MDEINEKLIKGKERIAGLGKGKSRIIPPTRGRLPPGQHEVKDWPVLDLGVHPEITRDNWTLTITGLVDKPVVLKWLDYIALPAVDKVTDFHCVTTWSRFDNHWKGVEFKTLCDLVKPKSAARYVAFASYDGYTTNLSLASALDDLLLVHEWEGQLLSREHGGPVRGVVSKIYAWKGAKWIKDIVFTDQDQLGFWEVRGYSNTADPWKEERFA